MLPLAPGRDFTWKEVLSIILIPVCWFLYSQTEKVRDELYNFRVSVAKNYATHEKLARLEEKLDKISEQIAALSVKVAAK
ncbi:MAG: hypothetical protein LBL52_03605 [Rickettsiales bacterium]|jgi:hypothetical protein|nr:hypothetical protein [Rickettsiales bacterium]